jgi:NADH dehydrogenase
MASGPRRRVVIVGGGFGGLNAARSLSRGPFEITIVDRDNYHGFWPLLYQVATAGLGADDIARPLRALFDDRPNVRVRLATVSDIDLDRRLVELDGEEDLPYDYLVLAAGSSTADFGIPGVNEHAFALKTIPDAVRLRNHILATFEQVDARPELADEGLLTIVLAGGGATGVELAGAVSELIAYNLARDFKHLDVARARVVLVEMADHILDGFSVRSQQSAMKALEAKGVEVRLDTAISEVTANSVTFGDGGVLPAGTVVWSAGVQPNPLGKRLRTARGDRGSVTVGPDLTIPGHPEAFVVGDLSGALDRHGEAYPMLAQVAIQGGRYAARAIRRRHDGKRVRPFHYRDKGIMATIGRQAAVAELPGGIRLSGTAGWLTWLVVHLFFLIGFRNRAVVLVNWAWNYVTRERSNRVILDQRSLSPSRSARA